MDYSELTNLVENKHIMEMEWEECYSACDTTTNNKCACVTLRATVDDCINIARRGFITKGKDVENISEEDLLLEFMVLNYAYPLKKEEK